MVADPVPAPFGPGFEPPDRRYRWAHMGRCYEFGVVIEEGCDHAMVVSPEGGACVCAGCGAGCTGRFGGCSAILAMPGHVPLAAPKGSLDGQARPQGVPLRAVSATGEAGPVRPLAMPEVPDAPERAPEHVVPDGLPLPRLAEVVDMFEELLARPDRTVDALAQLRRELEKRDEELLAAFDRLADAHSRIGEELAADREVRDRMVAVIEQLTDRLAAVEDTISRPILPTIFRREG